MSLSRSVPAPRPDAASSDKLIRLFQSETAEIRDGPQPVQAHLTVWVLLAMLVGVIAVAAVMPIDRVVSSNWGEIVTTEPTIVLQALDPSIIKSIDVQEGDRVKKGQLLGTLDPTFAAADVGALRRQIASLDAQIARCEAEIAGRPFELADSGSPEAGLYIALQRSYYLQRKAQFEAQSRAFDEQISQTKATIAKLQNDQVRYGDRSKIAREVEEMRATLAAAQVGSKLNLLQATDQKLEILRNLESDHNSLIESQHQLETTIANREAFVQQWFGQVSQELVTARNQRDAAVEQMAKASKHQALVQLEAPEDSVVLRLASGQTKLSVGSVLKEGDPFVSLAPLRSPMEAEVHIPARDIGFVRPGDRTVVKLDAFNYVEHGTAEGKVRWISEGSFTLDQNGSPTEPYYKARIALADVDLRNVPAGFRLMPGMTLAGDIQVGTRSLLGYMLRGLVRGVNESMREP